MKRFATSQFQNYFSFECDVKSRDMYANSSQFVKQILSVDAPKRQYKRKEAGPDDEKTRVRITLLEYGNRSLIGPSFGITAVKKSENEVVADDDLAAEVCELKSFPFFVQFRSIRVIRLKITGKKISFVIAELGPFSEPFGFVQIDFLIFCHLVSITWETTTITPSFP